MGNMDEATIQKEISLLEKIISEDVSSSNKDIFEELKRHLSEVSPIPLKNKIDGLEYEYSEDPVWCAEYERYYHCPPSLSSDVFKLLRFYKEKLFELSPAKTKEDLYKQKLLKAKNNSIDFIDKLGEIVVGDAPYFPYRSSYHITKFFAESGFSNLRHDGSTRRVWAKEQLENMSLDDLYRIVCCVFKEKYFNDEKSNIKKAKEFLKNELENAIKNDSIPNLDDVFDVDINTSLLFNEEINTEDNLLNKDIKQAREFYLNGNLQNAIEKIWDAFERIKSLYDKDKKQSVKKIVETLSDEIKSTKYNKDNSTDNLFFDNEIRDITNIGNAYKIRHSEISQIEITNDFTKRYLFFKVLNLINLIYSRMR